MSRYFVQTTGVDDWRALLAKPDLQWKEGRSAWLMAHKWQAADGFPEEVQNVLDSSEDPLLDGLQFVVGFPEYGTPLPGGSRPSQTDLLVLARNSAGDLVVIGVEGKVDETFGPLVGEWLQGASPGKLERLAFLCDRLCVDVASVGDLRYQLLHRTVAAVLEAERFGASAAVMLVHSFDPRHAGFDDYATFVRLLGGTPAINQTTPIAILNGELSLVWVSGHR